MLGEQGQEFLSSPVRLDRLWAHTVSYSVSTGVISQEVSGGGLMLTTRLHLASMLRVSGTILYTMTWTRTTLRFLQIKFCFGKKQTKNRVGLLKVAYVSGYTVGESNVFRAIRCQRFKQTLPTCFSLSKCHTFLEVTCICNFIYARKESTAFTGLIFTKLARCI
jgi:hypothetical protein